MLNPVYVVKMEKRYLLDKHGEHFSVINWDVLKNNYVKEIFYSLEDANKYIELLEKRDSDYTSLVESD